MQICKIGERQLEKALKLIQDIFEECDRELWVGGLTGSSNYTKAQYFLGGAALLHLNT